MRGQGVETAVVQEDNSLINELHPPLWTWTHSEGYCVALRTTTSRPSCTALWLGCSSTWQDQKTTNGGAQFEHVQWQIHGPLSIRPPHSTRSAVSKLRHAHVHRTTGKDGGGVSGLSLLLIRSTWWLRLPRLLHLWAHYEFITGTKCFPVGKRKVFYFMTV